MTLKEGKRKTIKVNSSSSRNKLPRQMVLGVRSPSVPVITAEAEKAGHFMPLTTQ